MASSGSDDLKRVLLTNAGVPQWSSDKAKELRGEPYGVLDIGLVDSTNGKLQCPHVDITQDNGGFIVMHVLSGEEAPWFFNGDTPPPLIQRTVLGMSQKTFDEERNKYPGLFKAVAPLLQPKDELLRG